MDEKPKFYLNTANAKMWKEMPYSSGYLNNVIPNMCKQIHLMSDSD